MINVFVGCRFDRRFPGCLSCFVRRSDQAHVLERGRPHPRKADAEPHQQGHKCIPHQPTRPSGVSGLTEIPKAPPQLGFIFRCQCAPAPRAWLKRRNMLRLKWQERLSKRLVPARQRCGASAPKQGIAKDEGADPRSDANEDRLARQKKRDHAHTDRGEPHP